MNHFETIPGLNLEKEKTEIDFSLLRENLLSEESHVDSNQDLLIREDTKQKLGIISKKRNLLPFSQIMDWVVNEFDRSGVSFKLKSSSLSKKSDLFQDYVFDTKLDTPDGLEISPRAIVKASYVGSRPPRGGVD